MIDLIHDAGANIDVRDADGETPLLNAVFKNHIGICRRLIDLGADVNAANYSSHESAISFATSFECHEIVPMLIEHGADYLVVSNSHESIAHNVAIYGGRQMLSTLSAMDLAGLDILMRDDTGKTAADYMAERDFFTDDSEAETRAAFEIFQQSILSRNLAAAESSATSASVKPEDEVCLPGAYPA